MPAKNSAPRADLERIAPQSLPIVTVPLADDAAAKAIHAKVGDLLQLNVDGLVDQPKRNADALNRITREGWETGEVLAYHPRVIRCIALQAMQKCFVAASDAVRGQNVLSGLEKGTGSPRTYAQVIPDWREMATKIDDPLVLTTIDASIGRIADALVDAKEKGTVVGVLRQLALRYGRKMFEALTEMKYGNLDKRATSGQLGTFDTNLAAVLAMLKHDRQYKGEQKPDQPEPALAELWEHPWLTQLRAAWMADTEKKLKAERQARGPAELLAERLKMLAAFPGIKQHEGALRQHYKIPARQARMLAGNDMSGLEFTTVATIIDRLVADKIIPVAVGSSFMQDYQALSEAVVEAPASFSQQVLARLADAPGMSNEDVTLALNPRERRPDEPSPVSLVVDSIRDARVNDAVSMHAVACLAANTLDDADRLAHAFTAEYKSRPKLATKHLSSPHLFMVEGAIVPADLPAPFNTMDIPMEDPHPTIPGLSEAILRAVWAKSAKTVERWNDYHGPRTVVDAFARLIEKASAARVLQHVPISKKSTVPRILAGEEVPTLTHLRQVLKDGSAVMTDELHIDWYRSAARISRAAKPPLASAMDILATSRSTSISAYTEEVAEASKANNARKTAVMLSNSETVSDDRFATLLSSLNIDAAPHGMYLRALRAHATVSDALNAWCQQLADANRMDLVLAALQARDVVSQPAAPEETPLHALRRAMERKAAIQQALTANSDSSSGNPILVVLSAAPGLTEDDLRQWKPDVQRASAAAVSVPRDTAGSVVRERVTEESPADAAYERIYERLELEVCPAEYRPYFDAFAEKNRLRVMFDYQWKNKQGNEQQIFATMKTSVSMQISKAMR